MKVVLGYTQLECSTWPVIRGVTFSIRQIAKDLTACFSKATRTSNTTYDCNEKIRAYKFAYDFADAYVEEVSSAKSYARRSSRCITQTEPTSHLSAKNKSAKPFTKSFQQRTHSG